MSTLTVNSSWIRCLSYSPLAPADKASGATGGFILVDTDHGRYAWQVPAWTVGLLAAAKARGLSVGSMFNKLVRRAGYPSVKVSK